MSEIDKKYQEVIKTHPRIGKPVGDEEICADNIGRYRDYDGGASIYYTPTTGAHLIYGLIRAKWIELGREQGPNGYPTTDEDDAKSGKGRYNNFQHGTIIWKRGEKEAFSVYGEIYKKWHETGFDSGALGFPLSDEADTATGDGRFNDFEHGAIYYKHALGAHVVKSPVLEAWTLAQREQGKFKYPIQDSQVSTSVPPVFSQKFEGGEIQCSDLASKSIVSRDSLNARIRPVTRNCLHSDAENALDDRCYTLQKLYRHLRLRTVVVIFRESYVRKFTDKDIAQLEDSYKQAAAKIKEFSFGLARVLFKPVVIDVPLSKADFNDYGQDGKPDTFQAEFNAYKKVTSALKAQGIDLAEIDVVSICIPWHDSQKNVASGFAWANPVFQLGDDKTYSTVHYIHPGDYAWPYFVHETFHCLEWMLEGHGYQALRNPDDKWWLQTYPELKSSSVVPPPVNLGNFGEYLLYAMYARLKGHWFELPPNWGAVIKNASGDASGDMLMYSTPDLHTVVESSVKVVYKPGK